MFKINKNANNYSFIADILASAIGFGASILVDGICSNLINGYSCSGIKKAIMKLGQIGLDTLTMYSVSSKMRDEIDDIVDGINDWSGAVDVYNEQKGLDISTTKGN